MNKINWLNPNTKITRNFTVQEALYLPQWDTRHVPNVEQQENIIFIANKLQIIRDLFNKPITVTSWIRPVLFNPTHDKHGWDYNKLVGGSKKSAHKLGMAVDFIVDGYNCDDVRNYLVPILELLEIRMENLPNSNWIHIDSSQVINNRYFKP